MVKTILPYRSRLKRLDVCGVGHSLVDVTVRVRDHELSQFGVKKGEQVFVSKQQIGALLQRVSSHAQTVGVGGNVRNTLQGLARFGDRTCYFSPVGRDAYGELVRADLQRHHIQNRLYSTRGMTGCCIALVTPDGERSMVTFPGDRSAVPCDAVPVEAIAQSKILYTAAYMVNDANRFRLFEHSVTAALHAGTVIAFDLADVGVVRDQRVRVQECIARGLIDILFGNAMELKALFGDDDSGLVRMEQQRIPIIVEKRGAEGATVITKTSRYDVPPPSRPVVDTTGAGDMFAAGFLHGLLRGYSLETCGALGSLVAGDKIAHAGIRLSEDIRRQIGDYLAAASIPKRRKRASRLAWLAEYRASYGRGRRLRITRHAHEIVIAGIQSEEEARMLIAAGVEQLGFPLRLAYHQEDISTEEAAGIIRRLGLEHCCVLITYLDTSQAIIELARTLGVTQVQLHGPIALSEVRELRSQWPECVIIKSLIVKPDQDVDALAEQVHDYSDHVDAFITDTFDPTTGACGATGRTHDWAVSRQLVRLSPKPVILAGGLRPENVYNAIMAVQPAAVDSHTGVEAEDGAKDPLKVRLFVQEAKRAFRASQRNTV